MNCCDMKTHLPFASSGLLHRLTDRSKSHLKSHDSFQEVKVGKKECACVCARCTQWEREKLCVRVCV